MSWQDLVGHDAVLDRFRRSHACDRMASTYLFVGTEGTGKRLFALKLAQALLCDNHSNELEPCNVCPACVQVANETHPDLILISKPDDKNFIPVELFLGDREHRRREGMCHDINLTPFSANRKIAIIDDADFLNAESANCLLKTLEEPPPNSILVLIGTSEHRQLPTILSRAQVVRFQSLSNQQVLSILEKIELPGEVPLRELAAASDGSVSRAIELDNQELFAFRESLFSHLASLDPADNQFAKTVCDFVGNASKEASVKRRYLRTIASFALQLLSNTLHIVANIEHGEPIGSEHNNYASHLIESCRDNNQSPPIEDLVASWIERTILFQRHVDANMATANIVPSWLNDLGAIARNEFANRAHVVNF